MFRPQPQNNRPVFELPDTGAEEKRGIERSYARLFSTEDGQRVLAHLQGMTFLRAYGPDAEDNHIRYAEGQRALVASILRLIRAGKSQ
jgi:hypothetical protein